MNYFVPPFVLERAATQDVRIAESLRQDIIFRETRELWEGISSTSDGGVVVWDCKNRWQQRVQHASGAEADEVRSKVQFTLDWLKNVLSRDGIDGAGGTVHVNIHYGSGYPNAFWDGDELTFGDGDGVIFRAFDRSIDVVAHELAHGLVQHTSRLKYQDQPGALNEHFADVIGTAVQQAYDSDTTDWLMGNEIMSHELRGESLRSMSYPGTAYDNDRMGRDRQPGHMSKLYVGSWDNGGVHVNSGIPNRAFYLVSRELGSQDAARLWYSALLRLWPTADFRATFDVLTDQARKTFPHGTAQLVRWAAQEVGIYD